MLCQSLGIVPLHSDVDFPFVHPVEEALHECGPLQRKGCDQEVESHTAEAVALQEGHEEAKANEDHHVHVLETCAKKTKNTNMSSVFGPSNLKFIIQTKKSVYKTGIKGYINYY